MPKMKKPVEGIHTTSGAEAPASEAPKRKRAAPKATPSPDPAEKLSYSVLSPLIRQAIIDIHKERGIRPDWPNVRAALGDCTRRMSRQWSQVLEDASRG